VGRNRGEKKKREKGERKKRKGSAVFYSSPLADTRQEREGKRKEKRQHTFFELSCCRTRSREIGRNAVVPTEEAGGKGEKGRKRKKKEDDADYRRCAPSRV